MTTGENPTVIEERRLPSPAITPQALAWHADALWLGSRDQNFWANHGRRMKSSRSRYRLNKHLSGKTHHASDGDQRR
jgi:hypothetical protein